MPWYRMPTGTEARRLAALRDASDHLEAAQCVVALAPSVDAAIRAPLMTALEQQLRCAADALRRGERQGAGDGAPPR